MRAVRSLPFEVGKDLITNFLIGNDDHEKIIKHGWQEQEYFGILAHHDPSKISVMIADLHRSGHLTLRELVGKKGAKVISLTLKGKKDTTLEGFTPFEQSYILPSDPVTEQERMVITSLNFFLGKYDEEQAKGIICDKKQILCVAGAGSGKTTVLTKRIEFLAKYRSIDPEKILAITFTKKAREEMIHRLSTIPECQRVHIETFNSFCERIIQQHLPQHAQGTIITYKDKIRIVLEAVSRCGTTLASSQNLYFTVPQRKSKSPEELMHSFVADVFSVIEHYKNERKTLEPFFSTIKDNLDRERARLLYTICAKVLQLMQEHNLRDYGDQLLEVITFFEKNESYVPQYDHILVDEYQDVNATQIQLLDLLQPSNIFVVGDPRQSIFAWRGSKNQFLMQFKERYSNAAIINLTKNYRSHQKIVNVANNVIKPMKLEEMKAYSTAEGEVKLISFPSEEAEGDFVLREVKNSGLPLDQIFVLARTNKQLQAVAYYLQLQKIPHIMKTDETKATTVKEGHLTLATVHAIKGLEAEIVFVIGCNSLYFPCKVSEHPVIEALALHTYNKEEEERRLFYVAITRAKQKLYLSYTGKNPTYFLDNDCLKHVATVEKLAPIPTMVKFQATRSSPHEIFSRLRSWRTETSRALGVPPYMILNDKTLQQLAEKMPLNTDELQEVYGMGPLKIAKFGGDVLDLVHGR